MYRKLLNQRQESLDRQRQNDGKGSTTSGRQYAKGNAALRSQFAELQQLVDRDSLAAASERKHDTQAASVMILMKPTPSVPGFQESLPSTCALTSMHMPESKMKISSYREMQMMPDVVVPQQQRARVSGSVSYLDQSRMKQISMATAADSKHDGPSSMKQLNKIEKMSQKQLKSFSKIQDKLLQSNENIKVNLGSSYNIIPQHTRYASNDYIDDLSRFNKNNESNLHQQSSQLQQQTTSQLRIPKKVKIQDKSAAQHQQILNSTQAHRKQSRSILKQNIVNSQPSTLNSDNSDSLFNENTAFDPKSPFKVRQKQSLSQIKMNKISSKTSALNKTHFINSTLQKKTELPAYGNMTSEAFASSQSGKNNKFSSPGNRDLPLEDNTIELLKRQSNTKVKLTKLQQQSHQTTQIQSYQTPQPNMGAIKKNKFSRQPSNSGIALIANGANSPQAQEPDTSYFGDFQIQASSKKMANKKNHQAYQTTQGFKPQSKGQFKAVLMAKLDLDNVILGGQAQIQPNQHNFGDASQVLPDYQMTDNLATKDEENEQYQPVLNMEQRHVVSQHIEKLDIQQAIRQKAKEFFVKEQSRLASMERDSHRKRDNSYETDIRNQTMSKLSSRMSSINSKRKKNKDKKDDQQQDSIFHNNASRARLVNDLISGKNVELKELNHDLKLEQDLLENIYSERQIQSTYNIQRKLKKMVNPDQNQSSEDRGSENNIDLDLSQEDQQSQEQNEEQKRLNTSEQFSNYDSDKPRPKFLLKKHSKLREKHLDAIEQTPIHIDSHNRNARFGQIISQDVTSKAKFSSGKLSSQINNINVPQRLGTQSSSPPTHRFKDQTQQFQQQKKLASPVPQTQQQIQLLSVGQKYKKAQKEKHARTMYNTRQVSPRHKLPSLKKDYSLYILDKYRFGLNQKAPLSTDPNAPDSHRFTQMASYRFAENNAPFMEIYDEQLMEYRKTRRFLAKEINKSPEGKSYAQKIQKEQDGLLKLQKKLHLELIQETIQEEVAGELQLTSKEKKQINGLKDIQAHNKDIKSRKALKSEFGSQNFSNTDSNRNSMTRMNVYKEKRYDKILFAESAASLGSQSQREMQQIQGLSNNLKNFTVHSGLDLNEDFMSDAGSDQKHGWKKATYEMDQLVTDEVFKEDQLKMGLSLYYQEADAEQVHKFRLQQRQLMDYLKILFAGDVKQDGFIDMAKNLTKKLKRQGTTDSHTQQRAIEIQDEQTMNLSIDEQNINSEIIGLLADSIMQRTEFFDMFKGNTRGEMETVQQSQLQRLEAGNERNKTELIQQPNGAATVFNRLDSIIINQKINIDSFLKTAVKNTDSQAHFESDMDNVKDVQKQMAKSKFIEECEKNMVNTLPLLLRINNKRLILERYQLNNGLCQALGIAFYYFNDIATDFYLESNNLSDDDFAVLLTGMTKLKQVQRLNYSHNEFGMKSLQALKPIICGRNNKSSMRNLHLIHCKMPANVTNDLLVMLNSEKNHIRCLSLVNVNLNQSNYKELINFIRGSKQLQQLDVSWNGMRCHQMYELIDCIVDNRSLQDLNLSYNNLHDSMQEKFAESTPYQKVKSQEQKDKLTFKIKNAKTQAQKTAAEIEAMGSSMQHVLKLIKFIKMNHNLMHLNLSGMGMTRQMMQEFGRALRRTKSLVSLHLSQQNGDNEALRAAICERAVIKPFEQVFRPDFKQLENLEYKLDSNDKAIKKEFKLENSIMFGEQAHEAERNAQGKSKISDQLNLKNMLKNKRGSVNRQEVESNPSEMLVFNRYLGHKIEMPGSGQWRMIATSNDSQERCWVCNLEQYSLVFWSRNFGIKQQKELFAQGIDEMAYENQLYELEARNKKLGIKVDFHKNEGNPQLSNGHDMIGYPQIYADFNNWKPQRMFSIEEFCYIIDKDKPDIIKNLQKSGVAREEVETVKDLNEKEKKVYNERVKKLMQKYHKMKNWRKLLGTKLRYQKPFLANAEALILGHDDVNIAKIDEELQPSDSETDMGSPSESDEFEEAQGADDEYAADGGDDYEDHLNSYYDDASSVKMRNQQRRMTLRADMMANIKILKDKTKMNKQLYVMPCFLTPGKQTFVVQSMMYHNDIVSTKGKSEMLASNESLNSPKSNSLYSDDPKSSLESDGELTEQFFFHRAIVPSRREKVPLFAKALKRKENEEVLFDRNQTVFKDWKPPTDKDLKKMLDHDSALWKLPRFIKEEKMYNEVYSIFEKNLRKLFYVYVTISANSNFPGITWLDFTKFTETCKINGGNVAQSDVDRYFLASAGEMASQGCYRYQFFESIMRVADLKYLKSGLTKTYSEAFKMFLDKNCFALGPTKEWQEFRDDNWWSYETHKIVHANMRAFQKIYKSFYAPRKKYMTKEDCIYLMLKQTEIMTDEKKVIYCYGMSKMHVINETQQGQAYLEMKQVEFLEFIGRCANIHYKEEDETLEEKFKMFLDELFPKFGMTRIEVEEEETELSESDPDY